jgi:tetratricopeptide (TPR) repeat protein
MLPKKRIVLFFLLGFFFHITSGFAQKTQYYWYRAIAAIENEDLNVAKVWLDSAIIQNPKNADYLLKLGEVYFLEEDFESALGVFQQVEKQKAGIASLWLAKTYALQGEKSKAIEELKRHLGTSEKKPEAEILLDPAFDILKISIEWTELWKNEYYSINDKFLAEVAYLFSRNNLNEIVDALSVRIEKSRTNHRLFALRGEAFFKLGSFKSAEADFSEAIKRSKRNPTYYEWRAKCRFNLKQYKGALKDINEAISLSEGNPKYLIIRAEAFSGMGNYADAAIDVKVYLTFYPNNIKSHLQLAHISFESSNYLDALFALGKVIRSGNANADCYELRGIIYTKSENWELAQADFTKAIEMEPKRAKALGLRGEMLIKQGKAQLGCVDLKKAIELGNFTAQELFYKHCRK